MGANVARILDEEGIEGYWRAAKDIALHGRRTPNLDREHEDDFLYVMYLMQRHFLEPDAVDAESAELRRTPHPRARGTPVAVARGARGRVGSEARAV